MGNYHIHMAFDIDGDRSEVEKRLSSPEGLASWWSDQVEGSMGSEGDKFYVTFPDAPAPFEFDVADTGPDTFEWHVETTPEWWAGTTIRFDVSENENGGTGLMFSHRNFEEGHPIVPIVTPAWALIVNNLKQVAESGDAAPFFRKA